jgi:hypothetical protein
VYTAYFVGALGSPLPSCTGTDWLKRKTEVVHENSRDFPIGDMPIKGVVDKLVGLVSEFSEQGS